MFGEDRKACLPTSQGVDATRVVFKQVCMYVCMYVHVHNSCIIWSCSN